MHNRLSLRSLIFFSVVLLLVCVYSSGSAQAVTNYIDNETLYSNQDPDTETRRSDHYRFCFGHYNRDTGTPMTEKLAQGNLQMFEHLWQRTIVEMGLNGLGQSAILEKRDGNFYRVNFNVLMTWNDGGGGGAYMSMDGNGFSYAMANTGYCRFDPPSGATPHELGHCWEGQARGFNGTDNAGAWWECTANWFQLQLLNTYPQARELLWNSMYYPAHGRDYYDSWAIWEAAREDARYGPLWINNVWTNATADQMAHEFIIERMIRLDSSGSLDKAGALKDLWGEMARKCVTWDYERQQWMQQVNRPDDGSDWYFYQRCRTPLVKIAGSDNLFRPARGHIPMEYGFNIIPLEANADSTITCTFDPQCDPVRQSDWRASLVAVSDNGDARYSSFWNTGTTAMKLAADEHKLYLVVIATPKPMKIPDPTWAAYKSDAGLQSSYILSFSNTVPRNVTWPVPGVSHHYHANGGGFVQDGATVDASAYVGPNAMVLNTAKVLGNARIEDYAVVRNNAQVRDNAVVSGHAVVQDNAQVYGNASVRDWARVFGYAEIYENGKVIEHANCGDGDASTHTKVYGSAVVKGTTYVYNPSTFGGSLIVDGDTANGNGTGSAADHGVHFGWSWGADAGRFAGLADNNYKYVQHTFEKDNAVFAIDEYGINHGFLINGCCSTKDTAAPTRGGLVLALDGTNQYVELHNSVNDFRETAVAVWVKWTGTAGDQKIWSMGDGAGKEMYLTPKAGATGKLQFIITDGTTTTTLDGAAALSGAAWTHIAVVFSGGDATLYVDGSAVGAGVATTLRPDLLNAPLMENANYLGRGNSGDYFQGYLDDFRVYSKALSSGEITAVYGEAAPGPVTIPADTTPPAPNAATWLVMPEAISDSALTMSATPGTDASGWVEYYFTCTAGGGHDSGWVSFNKFTAVGLTPGTPYTYTVMLRDRNGNTTAPSAAQSATTQTSSAPAAGFAYGPVGYRNGQIMMRAIEPESPSGLVEYKFDRSGGSSGWQSSPTWTDTGLTTGSGYSYTVTTRDGRGNTSAASAGVAAEASDQAGPILPITVANWEMMPYATIDNKISMSANAASDPSGVRYKFECVSGGGPDSGWQSSRTYVTPVVADGTYAYRYKTRDTSTAQNTSDYSTVYSATIKPTTGYHGYDMSVVSTLPDDYLVSFTGVVTAVHAGYYTVKDVYVDTLLSVKTSEIGEATDPAVSYKLVNVKGHLYTLNSERIVTFATVTVLGDPPGYSISGKVSNKDGTGIASATVYFSDLPDPVHNVRATTTTDGSGMYSKEMMPGTWYMAAGAGAYNTSTDKIVTVSSSDISGINFTLGDTVSISGSVTKRSDGTAIAGAKVYFSDSPDASAHPVFTATADGAGMYSQPLQNQTWYVCASAPDYYTSADKIVIVGGQVLSGIDISLKADTRNIPRTADLLFSAVTESLPDSGITGNWPTYIPSGQNLQSIASPTVAIANGCKWANNLNADGDGFRQGTYTEAIAVNGATIVAVIKPSRIVDSGNWRSIVDIFYDRLVLGIDNQTGRICVRRNGSMIWASSGTDIPDGQATVVSLVAQPTGQYKVYANGTQIMSNTGTSDMTSLVPNVPGAFANCINVGRNNPDAWTTYNGNIGDVFVYKIALSDAERQQLEADLFNKMMFYTITASAGTGVTIDPCGPVSVDYSGSQLFSIVSTSIYQVADVLVDGTSLGVNYSYTFTNVTANHTIDVETVIPEPVLFVLFGLGMLALAARKLQ